MLPVLLHMEVLHNHSLGFLPTFHFYRFLHLLPLLFSVIFPAFAAHSATHTGSVQPSAGTTSFFKSVIISSFFNISLPQTFYFDQVGSSSPV